MYIYISCTLGSYARNRYGDLEECGVLVYDGPSYPDLFKGIRFMSGIFYIQK